MQPELMIFSVPERSGDPGSQRSNKSHFAGFHPVWAARRAEIENSEQLRAAMSCGFLILSTSVVNGRERCVSLCERRSGGVKDSCVLLL